MAVANGPRTTAAPINKTFLPAARTLAFHSYGPMGVMTSPALDKTPLDLKASAFAPADGMALENGTNG